MLSPKQQLPGASCRGWYTWRNGEHVASTGEEFSIMQPSTLLLIFISHCSPRHCVEMLDTPPQMVIDPIHQGIVGS